VAAQEDPASRALAYLEAQQEGDGSVAGPAGSYADSELFAIAAAAAGYDPNALTATSGTSVMAYLSAHAGSACTASTPGPCGELIQAVIAAGANPASFGGQNLLTTLDAAYAPATGEYGDGEAFTQALAIQGLAAAGAPVPPAATQFLKAAQDSDGGWDYLDIKDDTTNPYDLSDTNSTAMVLMALDAAGDHGRDASALAWLATQEDQDGGFPYQAGAGSDPDSTALVLQAIVATGQDPAATAWTQGGHTPLTYLVATQDAGGGYTFPGASSPDPFTTSQVTPALERLAFPIAFGTRSWYQPGSTLDSSPTASPTPSPIPTSPTPTGPPAGVITPSTPTPSQAAVAPASAGIRAASSSPAAGATAAGAVAATAAAGTAAAPLGPSPAGTSPAAPRTGVLPAVPAPQGWPPALLLLVLVALGAAAVAGGARLLWARR